MESNPALIKNTKQMAKVKEEKNIIDRKGKAGWEMFVKRKKKKKEALNKI